MTKERACAKELLHAGEQLERIHQLALVGQAALNTNLSRPHIDKAVAELLDLVAELCGNSADQVLSVERTLQINS